MSSNGNGHRPDRWDGIERPYTPADVESLRGSVTIEHTLARLGAERLWELLRTEPQVARCVVVGHHADDNLGTFRCRPR